MKKGLKIGLIVLGILVILIWSYNYLYNFPLVPDKFEPEYIFEQRCQVFNGSFIESALECEYISQENCNLMKGSFNECASACRNNPEAEFCTMQCVPVCQF